MTGCQTVQRGSGWSGGASPPTFGFGNSRNQPCAMQAVAAAEYSVDITAGMLHYPLPMARQLFAEIKLRGSTSLSYGALACPDSQPLDHQRWLGRREPANTGRPVIVCR